MLYLIDMYLYLFAFSIYNILILEKTPCSNDNFRTILTSLSKNTIGAEPSRRRKTNPDPMDPNLNNNKPLENGLFIKQNFMSNS